MRRAAAAAVMILALALSAPALAKAPPFLGTWSAEKIKSGDKERPVPKGLTLRFTFDKGGKFVGTIKTPAKSKVSEGTWKVEDKVLVTELNGRVERMRYKVKGKRLILHKLKTKERLFLTRYKK